MGIIGFPKDVALGAIFSMGIIGAGTNNARLAGLLRLWSSAGDWPAAASLELLQGSCGAFL